MQHDLEVQDVTKKFDTFTAVDKVNFHVEQGSFFSILGPSGCGKTTLLRMIAGFETPTNGRISIRGKDVTNVSPNKRPVNLIFQHLALFPMMNVAENIGFGLARQGSKKDAIGRKVTEILDRVGLPGYGDKKINQLSGGQKQRVAIARCLVLDPTVLLLDEPLGALDLKLREQMKIELKKIQEKIGTTFIYITHDQSEALVMSDNIAVMNEGHFEQLGSPQELYGKPKTAFVAKFVGNNNNIGAVVIENTGKYLKIRHESGKEFSLQIDTNYKVGTSVEYLLRPESIMINPSKDIVDLNRISIKISSVLFDGANSQLLGKPSNFDEEFLISLPQNRLYDHIKPGDVIEVGWNVNSGLCFENE